MIKNSIYKNYLVIIFLGFSNNIFSKNYCQNCCDCCDCCKKGNETEEDEENISGKSSFKSDVSKNKANIDNNLKEEIKKLNTESNAFKYLKIQEAIDVYNEDNNNKILRKNNLRNKIILYKNLVGIEAFNDEDIKKYIDDKYYNRNQGGEGRYDFENVMKLFKSSLKENNPLIPTKKFFKYFYQPEYLGTDFNLEKKPKSEYLSQNSEIFGYIQLSQTECDNDNVGNLYSAANNILTNYLEKYYSYFIDFYKMKLHQIYKWLDDNQKIANLNDPENIYTLLDIITKQRIGACKNEAENIISSMYSTIISYMNKNFKIGDFEVFTYSILSDFRQAVAKDVVNMMISQPNENNCLKSKTNNDKIDVDSAQEKANIIRIYLNSFLISQVMSYLSFFDKAVEQANKFLKDFFNFGRLFEIILQYTKQAQANVSIKRFIDEIKEIEVTYSDICAITEIPEVKEQIGRKIKKIDNESFKKSFKERLNLYLKKDNNDFLKEWKNNNSQKPLKELIEICKQDYNEDVNDSCDHYFYLPELTEFYFNDDFDNIINYFTYILFPLYLLKEKYIKIKS